MNSEQLQLLITRNQAVARIADRTAPQQIIILNSIYACFRDIAQAYWLWGHLCSDVKPVVKPRGRGRGQRNEAKAEAEAISGGWDQGRGEK